MPRLAALPLLIVVLALPSSADSSTITTVVGNGAGGYAGDGGPATAASLLWPDDVAIDWAGNLYIADRGNNRIRMVLAATGTITTLAGNGIGGFSGDGGPATAARLDGPKAVAVDSAGQVYIADTNNQRVRRVDRSTGIITTVAGNGTADSGDGGPATSAGLSNPSGLAFDGSGNLYIAALDGHRVRRVAAGTGIITTVAGNGIAGYSGDGGPATAATLNFPARLALDGAGNLFVADSNNHAVRRVDAATGVITTVAGTGVPAFSGDGGPAVQATLGIPEGVALDSFGNLYINDSNNGRVRRVDAATGIITTVAGNGAWGFGGDDGPAALATFATLQGLAAGQNGKIFVADSMNNRIRQVVVVVDTSTTLASDAAPSTYRQPVTLTATLTPGYVTGVVEFFDAGVSLGTVQLSNGRATLISSTLGAGSHSINAVYGGATGFNPSTSSAWTQVVNQAATATSVSSNNNAVNPGQPVNLSAYVSPSLAGGLVQFYDGGTAIGSVALSGGVAALTVTLASGSHPITAVYSGDPNYMGSSSPAYDQIVKFNTTLTLASSANPSTFGQALTFAATISPSSASGGVQFYDGATSLGVRSLSGGVATLTLSTPLNAGTHTIRAVYAGDLGHLGSEGSVVQTVNKTPTTTSLVSSANPSVRNQQVTFTASVAPVSWVTGSLQFRDGSTVLATVALNGGSAAFSTSSLAVGTHPITAVFSGDVNHNSSTSPVLSQTVKRK